ncbi:MAG: TIGR01777 family oxidoreductase [Desulfohalobiaceae bacterium]|nr:TIGR01777 family oxidoreductase [Desulfohalobiaceae bacterium]
MHVFLMGSTGFLGRHLASHLHAQGHTLSLLVRSEGKKGMFPSGCEIITGDPLQPGAWQERAAQSEVVVNLVGKNIFARWTEQEKDQIYSTRIQATRMAVQAIAQSDSPPALINANAVGYYDPTNWDAATESSLPGEGFLSRVCIDWQSEALKAEKHGSRVVILRIAPPLAKDGGVLATMLTPFRLGLGGRIGSGKQPFPWIHITDFLRAVEFLAGNREISGPANLCAPGLVNNAEFTRTLARVLGRPAFLPIPATLLKLTLGEMSQMLLQGPKAKPDVLLQSGFDFRFPSLLAALQDLLSE